MKPDRGPPAPRRFLAVAVVAVALLAGCGRETARPLGAEEYRIAIAEDLAAAEAALNTFGAACTDSNGLFATEACLASLDDGAAAFKKLERRLASLPVGGEVRRANDGLRGASLCMAAAMTLLRTGTGHSITYYTTGIDLMKTCPREIDAALGVLSSAGGEPPAARSSPSVGHQEAP